MQGCKVVTIDTDFSDQDAVFTDLQSKYGEENVARIIAFGTMSGKSVARKVLNAFGFSQAEIKYITSMIGESETIYEALERDKALLSFAQKHEKEFAIMKKLDGVISHVSQHAGGIIVYPNLSAHLPLTTGSEDRSKRIVAFDKYMLEELG